MKPSSFEEFHLRRSCSKEMPMIRTTQIGSAVLSIVQEYYGPSHSPTQLLPQADQAVIEANRHWLAPDFWIPSVNRFVVSLHTWVLKVDDKVILIDTGVGNGKNRPAFERLHRLNTQYMGWLEAAGVSAEAVTHVIATHLHPDHIGWNTRYVSNEWVPTFPNARYLMPRECLDYMKQAALNDPQHGYSLAFEDSVVPLLQRGLVDAFESTDLLPGGLQAEPATGHMVGQVSLHFQSHGEHAMFCGDMIHHPIQVLRPDWNSCFDSHPELASETRHRLLDLAADRHALLLPAHFGNPNAGYVRRAAAAFTFEPAQWPALAN
jgi:glyoxylase-like metal-dependent hydrolase (beta-lactamase superfamily II)